MVNIVSLNTSQTNVTGLTKGDYKFKVTVTDNNGNTDSDVVYISVTQSMQKSKTGNFVIRNTSLSFMQIKIRNQKQMVVETLKWNCLAAQSF